MQQYPPWAKALQIPSAKCDEWKALVPAGQSFTFWCLLTGRLPSDRYFEWAKEHHGLPKLTEAYFELPPNRTLWESIDGVANWSPSMLPLEQWDGVIFIACVEPPDHVKWSFRTAYILAEPQMLDRLWRRLNEATVVKTSSGVMIKLEDQIASVLKQKDHKSAPAKVAKKRPEPPPNLNIPGLSDDPKLSTPLGLSIALPPMPPAPAKTEKLAPANLALPFNLTATPPPLHRPAEDTPPPIPGPSELTSTIILAPPPANPIERQAANAMAGPLAISAAPETIDQAKTQDESVAWFFRQIRTRFQTGMLLLHDKNGLQPWKWEPGMKMPEAGVSVISFESPSLFRVVARTLRSYHGFVVENVMHKAFFREWGFAQVPKHVTAVPVVINGSFRGLFLCIASDPKLPPDTLEFVEMNADKTVHHLDKILSPFASTSTAA